jgi:hypothetical protein
LTTVDYKFFNNSFELGPYGSPRTPFGYTVSGFLFTQLSISLLQITGRSLIFTRFGPDAQPSAQTWTATLTLSTSFVFRLIIGLVIRTNDLVPFDPAYTRSVTIPFAVVGLIGVVASLFLTPWPTTELSGVDWKTFTSIKEVPGFFGIAVPIIIVVLVYSALDNATPFGIAASTMSRIAGGWAWSPSGFCLWSESQELGFRYGSASRARLSSVCL